MLHLGDYRDTLADVSAQAVIVDPPYGERTYVGNAGRAIVDTGRRQISYTFWTPLAVHGFVQFWSPRCSGWIAAMTSDDLIPVWRAAYAAVGRLDFAPVPIVAPRVRLSGDGPASSAVYLMVARPREKRFTSWGALPGWYEAPVERDGHIGGKPIGLMRAIVRDYSRAGDLVCDPCAGFGTTLLAARIEGRSSVGAEIDASAHAEAVRRLDGAYAPDLFAGVT
jgi:hypothetical protein